MSCNCKFQRDSAGRCLRCDQPDRPQHDQWDQLQREIVAWALANFGQATASQLFTGLVEELGEYDRATTTADRVDALADQAIYIANLAQVAGIRMSELVGDWWPQHQSALDMLGKMAHVILKSEQGIRGVDPERLRTVCLDCLRWWFARTARFCYWVAPLSSTVLAPLVSTEGRCLLIATQRVWEQVKQRNWKANPVDGK